MQRLWNLNWENITYDHDISGLMRGLIDWGVIEGGTVVGNKLQPVQAIVPLVRSNGQKILAFFESDEVIDLPTTGDYKVYIEVDQSKIDFGGNNAENGTGIASIKTWPSVPSQNFLLLATATGGVVRLDRTIIPKVGQLAWRIAQVERKTAASESKIERLEEAGKPDSVRVKYLVAEKYAANDGLFLYDTYTPHDKCLIPLSFGDTQYSKAIHIMKIASGQKSKNLTLKLRKKNNCYSNVIVEIQKADSYDSGSDTLRSGNWTVLATTTIAAHTIRDTWTVVNLEFPELSPTRGELLAIVIKCEWGAINPTQYYELACAVDVSVWCSALSVWDTSKTPKYLLPFSDSALFERKVLVKKRSLSSTVVTEKYVRTNTTDRVNYTPLTWSVSLQFQIVSSNSRDFYRGFYVRSNGNLIVNDQSYRTEHSIGFTSATPVEISWHFNGTDFTSQSLTIRETLTRQSQHPLSPNSVKSVGQEAEITLIWMNDWELVLPRVLAPDPQLVDSVITGSITPGNYVKFLTIQWPDGKIYKIWLYW